MAPNLDHTKLANYVWVLHFMDVSNEMGYNGWTGKIQMCTQPNMTFYIHARDKKKSGFTEQGRY
jgi:hypothetical protein